MTLTCTRCGKKLSRKTARQIDGKPVCSPCMFSPTRVNRDQWDCGGRCILGGLVGPGRDCDACWAGTGIAQPHSEDQS